MKRHLLLITAIIAVLGMHTATGDAKEPPVISVASRPTGLRVLSARTGQQMTPGLDIYSDGLVYIRRYDGTEQTKYIRVEKLKPLIESLKKTKFYEVTEKSFNESTTVDGVDRVYITDLPDTSLAIREGSTTYSTHIYGLWEYAKEYPRIKRLKSLQNAIISVYKAADEKLP